MTAFVVCFHSDWGEMESQCTFHSSFFTLSSYPLHTLSKTNFSMVSLNSYVCSHPSAFTHVLPSSLNGLLQLNIQEITQKSLEILKPYVREKMQYSSFYLILLNIMISTSNHFSANDIILLVFYVRIIF
jgi:hypothetical protein